MRFAGTNWTTTEQLVKNARRPGLKNLTKKHQSKKMQINKELVWNAMQHLNKQQFTMNELFKSIADEIQEKNGNYPKVFRYHDIIQTAVNITGTSLSELKSTTRIRHIVYVRQVAVYLIQKYTGLTMLKTGEIFNRDHSTVIASMRRVNDAKNGFNDELLHILELVESCLLTEKTI